ncbi:hypothetical protein L226DRAFT_106387 [Lentinus tigrinus ALCF2SS1-7]|uniref:uncharacterized protein n=1 Tax=Lentinus tigrinus ALCF2SS1-7 TaxID=1328758 RepID=UPI001165FB3C|nr:hypothetical protein L226DRAFT_106387 [Lentinus tigrinus ALCF2SS1-7]
MSSADADSIAAAYVELFTGIYPNAYFSLAISTLVIYEAIITFDREVACFWTRNLKWSGASLLFFANKYITVALHTVNMVSFAQFPERGRCNTMQKAWFLLQFLQLTCSAAFSILRASVLSQSRAVVLLVAGLSLPLLGAHLVPFGYGVSGTNLPSFGCVSADRIPPTVAIRYSSSSPEFPSCWPTSCSSTSPGEVWAAEMSFETSDGVDGGYRCQASSCATEQSTSRTSASLSVQLCTTSRASSSRLGCSLF